MQRILGAELLSGSGLGQQFFGVIARLGIHVSAREHARQLLNSVLVAEWLDVGVVAIFTDPHMILAKCRHLRGMGDTKHLGMRSKIAQDPSNGIRCCAADADIRFIQYEAG